MIDFSDPDLWIDLELYGPAHECWVDTLLDDDSLLEDILETALGFFGL